MTVYLGGVNPTTRKEDWTRVQVRCVEWEDRRGAAARTDQKDDAVQVFIPYERGPLAIKPGDVIVRGLVTDAIGPSFTITDLKKKYPQSAVVRSVDLMDMGSQALWHWQIGAT